MRLRHRPPRALVGVLLAAAVVLTGGAAPPGDASTGWTWPLDGVRIVRAYVQPAHDYAPGHRGIDLAAPVGSAVRAPAAGIIAFSGAVAGRGILTIDQGGGFVTTLEPIDSPLAAGDAVERGATVGTVSIGGHADPGTLHFGVRRDGAYINPLLLLGGVPRAVLLPCCG